MLPSPRTSTRLFFLAITAVTFIQAFVSLDKCQRETNFMVETNPALPEAYPSNITCTFLNDTYCAADLSDAYQDYAFQCFNAKGRIVLIHSTAKCTSSLDNKTTLYSISNDPWCLAINCSQDQAGELYNYNDRYEDMGINTEECDMYSILAEWPTALTGLCAWETDGIHRHLPQVEATIVCTNDTCVTNYTLSAELYFKECYYSSGVAIRQPERSWTCYANDDSFLAKSIEINVPFCLSSICSENATTEEEAFLHEKWMYQSQNPEGTKWCVYGSAAWEILNSTQIFPVQPVFSGDHCSVMRMWRWTALYFIVILAVTLGDSA